MTKEPKRVSPEINVAAYYSKTYNYRFHKGGSLQDGGSYLKSTLVLKDASLANSNYEGG